MGSLSLLHGIFPTQESNQGLLHCRQILYPLSYRGSPKQPYKGSQDNPIKQIQLMLQFCKRTNSASEMKVLPRQQMIELGVSLRFDSKTCVPDPLNYDFLIIKIQLRYIMPPSSFLPHQSSLCWFWLSWIPRVGMACASFGVAASSVSSWRVDQGQPGLGGHFQPEVVTMLLYLSISYFSLQFHPTRMSHKNIHCLGVGHSCNSRCVKSCCMNQP